jgi:hypothetical protein
MDDELRELECELRALRPMPPSAALQERLRRALDPDTVAPLSLLRPADKLRQYHWWWLAAFPAATAALFAVLLALRAPHRAGPGAPKPAGPRPVAVVHAADHGLKPVAAENLLYATDDEGLVTLADGTPARRERLHFIDTITWRNPQTNASLRWSVPREEVHVTPVVFQ